MKNLIKIAKLRCFKINNVSEALDIDLWYNKLDICKMHDQESPKWNVWINLHEKIENNLKFEIIKKIKIL